MLNPHTQLPVLPQFYIKLMANNRGWITMATINVRQLNDGLVQKLKQRAVRNDRSLESEVCHILARAVEDDMAAKREAFLALAAKLRRKTEGRAQTPSEVLIREDRDNKHRVG